MNTIFQILKSDVNYFWIILSMVIAAFSHIARAFRWRLQLRALNITPSMRVLINAIFGTYAIRRGLALRLCGSAGKGIIYESIGIYGFRPSLRYDNARNAYVCGIHDSNEAVPSIFE